MDTVTGLFDVFVSGFGFGLFLWGVAFAFGSALRLAWHIMLK